MWPRLCAILSIASVLATGSLARTQAATASCRSTCTLSNPTVAPVPGTDGSYAFGITIDTAPGDYPVLQYCVAGTCSGPISNCYARSTDSSGATRWECYDEAAPAILPGEPLTYGFQICDNNFAGTPPYVLANCQDLGLPYGGTPTAVPFRRLRISRHGAISTVQWQAPRIYHAFNLYEHGRRLNQRPIMAIRGWYRFRTHRLLRHPIPVPIG